LHKNKRFTVVLSPLINNYKITQILRTKCLFINVEDTGPCYKRNLAEVELERNFAS